MVVSRLRLALVFVVLSAGLAGCVGEITDDGDDGALAEADNVDDVDELLALTEQGGDALETYEAEMTIEQDIEMMGEEVTQTIIADQTVDLADQKIAQSIEMEMPEGGGDVEQEQIDSYIVDDTMYMQDPMEGWMTQDVDNELMGDGFWEEEELQEQYELIGEADIEVTGTEERNGVEVAVIEFEYTGELIEEVMDEMEDQPIADTSAIEDGSVTQYVGTEDGYIHGVEQEMVMSVLGQEIEQEMEMTVTNHNEPVDIEVPEEALDADG